MSLPADEPRCDGMSEDGEWGEDCKNCQRRTTTDPDPQRVQKIEPPRIIVFECEWRLPP